MTTETLTTPVMQKNVTVKVYNTVTKTYEVIELTKDGKTTTIKATKNVNYEFFDHSIGRAPNHIITRRVGKDLRISFERQGQEDDLIIEDFYEIADQSHSLIGIAEDDGYYYYIPDTGEVPDYVTQLADGDAEGHALGGERLAAPLFILPPPVGFPWWLATGIIPFLPRKDKILTVAADAEVGDFGRVSGAGNTKLLDLTKQDPSILSGSKPIDWSTVQFVDGNGNRTDTITTTDGVWTLQQDASGKKTGVAIFTPHSIYYTGHPDPVNYTVNTTDGQSAGIGTIKVTYPNTFSDSKSGESGKPVVQNVIENDEEGYDKTTVKLVDLATHRETDKLVVLGQGTWEVEKDPVTGKSTGNIIFTPEPGFTANPTPASYVVYVQDPATGEFGRSNITGVAVTYPSLTTADHAKGQLGQPVTQKVTANDDNVNPTTLQLVDPITHGLTDKIIVPGEGTWTLVKDPTGTPTGEVTFTPESGFDSSPTPITYVVKKSPTDTDYQNPTPVAVSYTPILSPDVKAGNPGEPVTQNVVTNDSREIDPKTVELIDPITGKVSNSVTVPNQGTWTTDGQGNVTFTPEPNFKGDPDPIKYKALDKNGNQIPETTVDVAVALPAPVLVPDIKLGEAGKPVMQDIASNDDAELDPTTLQLIDPKNPSALSDTLVVAGEGTWTLDKDPATGKPNGNITFTPEAGFMSSPSTIQYTGKDKKGRDIKPTTVDIIVPPAPATPTSPDSKVGNPGEPVTQNVTTNDGNGIDPASIKLVDPKNPNTPPSDSVTVPGQGTWTLVKDPTGTPTGEVTFTPEPNFKGDPDPITYTGKDKNGNDVPPNTVDVVVPTNPNETPTSPDSKVGNPGEPVTQNVTTNDGNGIDPASIKLVDPKNPNTPPSDSVTVPGQGTWTLVKDPTGTPTGEVTFTPEPNFKGDPDPIEYTGKDKNGNDVPPNTVDVVVPTPVTPTVPDVKIGQPGEPVTQNVTTNDGNGIDPASIKLVDPKNPNTPPSDSVTVPGQGTWTLVKDPTGTPTGEVTFTPEPNFKGDPDPITYTGKDKNGNDVPPNTVDVVVPTPVTPTVPDVKIGQPGEPVTQNVTTNDGNGIDPASIKLVDPKNPNTPPSDSVTVPGQGTWTLVKDPTGTPTGEVTFTPEPNFKGDPDPIEYTGKDKNGNDIPPTGVDVIVDLTPAVALPDSKPGTQGQPVTQNVTNNDGSVKPETVKLIDPISGTLTDKVVVPNEGTWTLKPGTDEVTFTPNPDFKDSPKPINYIVVDNITGTTLPPTPVNVVYPQDVSTPATVAISAVKPSSVEGQTPADTLEFKLTLTDTSGQVGSADVLVRADNASVVRKEDVERVSIDGQEVNIDDFFGKGVEVKGVTTNNAPVIVLTVKDDNLPENSELVSLTISTTTNGVLVTQPTATGVIKDEAWPQDPKKNPHDPQDPTNPNNNPPVDNTEGDKPAKVSIDGVKEVNEAIGQVTYVVSLDRPAKEDTYVTISIGAGTGTGTSSADTGNTPVKQSADSADVNNGFTTTKVVKIDKGATSTNVVVDITNDDTYETAEDYTVAITAVSKDNAGATSETASIDTAKQSVTTIILDNGTGTTVDPNDPTPPTGTDIPPKDDDRKEPSVSIETVDGTATEGSAPTLTYKVTLADSNDKLPEGAKVTVTATGNNKAVDKADFDSIKVGDNTYLAGSPEFDKFFTDGLEVTVTKGQEPTITLTAKDDNDYEQVEGVKLTLSNPASAKTGDNTPVNLGTESAVGEVKDEAWPQDPKKNPHDPQDPTNPNNNPPVDNTEGDKPAKVSIDGVKEVNEAIGQVTYVVSLDRPAKEDTYVTISIGAGTGTGTSSADTGNTPVKQSADSADVNNGFTTTKVVKIDKGATSTNVVVDITNDDTYETAEDYTVAITAVSKDNAGATSETASIDTAKQSVTTIILDNGTGTTVDPNDPTPPTGTDIPPKDDDRKEPSVSIETVDGTATEGSAPTLTYKVTLADTNDKLPEGAKVTVTATGNNKAVDKADFDSIKVGDNTYLAGSPEFDKFFTDGLEVTVTKGQEPTITLTAKDDNDYEQVEGVKLTLSNPASAKTGDNTPVNLGTESAVGEVKDEAWPQDPKKNPHDPQDPTNPNNNPPVDNTEGDKPAKVSIDGVKEVNEAIGQVTYVVSLDRPAKEDTYVTISIGAGTGTGTSSADTGNTPVKQSADSADVNNGFTTTKVVKIDKGATSTNVVVDITNDDTYETAEDYTVAITAVSKDNAGATSETASIDTAKQSVTTIILDNGTGTTVDPNDPTPPTGTDIPPKDDDRKEPSVSIETVDGTATEGSAPTLTYKVTLADTNDKLPEGAKVTVTATGNNKAVDKADFDSIKVGDNTYLAGSPEFDKFFTDGLEVTVTKGQEPTITLTAKDDNDYEQVEGVKLTLSNPASAKTGDNTPVNLGTESAVGEVKDEAWPQDPKKNPHDPQDPTNPNNNPPVDNTEGDKPAKVSIDGVKEVNEAIGQVTYVVSLDRPAKEDTYVTISIGAGTGTGTSSADTGNTPVKQSADSADVNNGFTTTKVVKIDKGATSTNVVVDITNDDTYETAEDYTVAITAVSKDNAGATSETASIDTAKQSVTTIILDNGTGTTVDPNDPTPPTGTDIPPKDDDRKEPSVSIETVDGTATEGSAPTLTYKVTLADTNDKLPEGAKVTVTATGNNKAVDKADFDSIKVGDNTYLAGSPEFDKFFTDGLEVTVTKGQEPTITLTAKDDNDYEQVEGVKLTLSNPASAKTGDNTPVNLGTESAVGEVKDEAWPQDPKKNPHDPQDPTNPNNNPPVDNTEGDKPAKVSIDGVKEVNEAIGQVTYVVSLDRPAKEDTYVTISIGAGTGTGTSSADTGNTPVKQSADSADVNNGFTTTKVVKIDKGATSTNVVVDITNDDTYETAEDYTVAITAVSKDNAGATSETASIDTAKQSVTTIILDNGTGTTVDPNDPTPPTGTDIPPKDDDRKEPSVSIETVDGTATEGSAPTLTYKVTLADTNDKLPEGAKVTVTATGNNKAVDKADFDSIKVGDNTYLAGSPEFDKFFTDGLEVTVTKGQEPTITLTAKDDNDYEQVEGVKLTLSNPASAKTGDNTPVNLGTESAVGEVKDEAWPQDPKKNPHDPQDPTNPNNNPPVDNTEGDKPAKVSIDGVKEVNEAIGQVTYVVSLDRPAKEDTYVTISIGAGTGTGTSSADTGNTPVKQSADSADVNNGFTTTKVVKIDKGATSTNVVVDITNDDTYETAEDYTVAITAVSKDNAGATSETASIDTAKQSVTTIILDNGTGTTVDPNDPTPPTGTDIPPKDDDRKEPSVSIETVDGTATEGSAPTLTYKVTLADTNDKLPEGAKVTVTATGNNKAVDKADFDSIKVGDNTYLAGSPEFDKFFTDGLEVTVTKGQEPTITLTAKDDNDYEQVEGVKLTLSNPASAKTGDNTPVNLGTESAVGEVKDEAWPQDPKKNPHDPQDPTNPNNNPPVDNTEGDKPAKVSIDGVKEVNEAIGQVTYVVSLDRPAKEDTYVTISIGAGTGTGTSSADTGNTPVKQSADSADVNNGFTTTKVVKIDKGATSTNVVVDITNDDTYETAEDYTVAITAVSKDNAGATSETASIDTAKQSVTTIILDNGTGTTVDPNDPTPPTGTDIPPKDDDRKEPSVSIETVDGTATEGSAPTLTYKVTLADTNDKLPEGAKVTVTATGNNKAVDKADFDSIKVGDNTYLAGSPEFDKFFTDGLEVTVTKGQEPTITLTAKDDNDYEQVEGVKLTLSNPKSAKTGDNTPVNLGTESAVGEVKDEAWPQDPKKNPHDPQDPTNPNNNPPVDNTEGDKPAKVSIDGVKEVNEAIGQVTYVVSLDRPAKEDTYVTISIGAGTGTGTSSADTGNTPVKQSADTADVNNGFTTTKVVKIDKGATSTNVVVDITNDDTYETAEDYTVAITAVSKDNAGATSETASIDTAKQSVTTIILDNGTGTTVDPNDPTPPTGTDIPPKDDDRKEPSVSIETVDGTATEGSAPTLTYKVTLADTNDKLPEGAKVTVTATGNNKAVDKADFDSIKVGDNTYLAGSPEFDKFFTDGLEVTVTKGQEPTITLTAKDDNDYEQVEGVKLTLSNPKSAKTGDNTPVNLGTESAVGEVKDEAWPQDPKKNPHDPQDPTNPNNNPPVDNTEGDKPAKVSIDGVKEVNEAIGQVTYVVSLDRPAKEDTYVTISIGAGTGTGTSSADTGNTPVKQSADSADVNNGFTTTKVVKIDKGATSTNVVVDITNDDTYETAEDYTVAITAVSKDNAGATSETASIDTAKQSVTTIILDNGTGTTVDPNDPTPPTGTDIPPKDDDRKEPSVSIETVDGTATEGSAPTLTYKVTLADSNDKLPEGAKVTVTATGNNKAVDKADFDSIKVGDNTYLAGSPEFDKFFTDGLEVTVTKGDAPEITLTAKDDNDYEQVEGVKLTLSNPASAKTGDNTPVNLGTESAVGEVKDEAWPQDPKKNPHDPQDPTNPNNNPPVDNTEGDKPAKVSIDGVKEVNEAIGQVTYVVSLDRPAKEDTYVTISIGAGTGTGTSSADTGNTPVKQSADSADVNNGFTTTKVVKIDKGATSTNVVVDITNDDTYETAEDYTVAITAVSKDNAGATSETASIDTAKQSVTTIILDNGTGTTVDPNDPTPPTGTDIPPKDDDRKEPSVSIETVDGTATEGSAPALTYKVTLADSNDKLPEGAKVTVTATGNNKAVDKADFDSIKVGDNTYLAGSPEFDKFFTDGLEVTVTKGQEPTITLTAKDDNTYEQVEGVKLTLSNPKSAKTGDNTPVNLGTESAVGEVKDEAWPQDPKKNPHDPQDPTNPNNNPPVDNTEGDKPAKVSIDGVKEVNEAIGQVTYVVSLDRPAKEDTYVTISIGAGTGTGTSSADTGNTPVKQSADSADVNNGFTTTKVVKIDKGATSTNVVVDITNDDTYETAEDYTVAITAVSKDNAGATSETASIDTAKQSVTTIILDNGTGTTVDPNDPTPPTGTDIPPKDDDKPTLTIESGTFAEADPVPANVPNATGYAHFNLKLDKVSALPITVKLSTGQDTDTQTVDATVNTDFKPSYQVSFDNGATWEDVTDGNLIILADKTDTSTHPILVRVPLVNDNTPEPTETFTLTATETGTSVLKNTTAPSAVATITDNDKSSINTPKTDPQNPSEFVADSNSVAESAGTANPVTGTMTITQPAGVQTLTVAGRDITNASTQNVSIDGREGTLLITGYDKTSGTINYTYTENGTDNDHSNNQRIFDTFEVQLTDKSGQSDTQNLVIEITDTEPVAVADNDQVGKVGNDETRPQTATGNILDGTSGNLADGNKADTLKDGVTLTSVQGTTINENGETRIEGVYGNLFIAKNGTYRYELNKDDPQTIALIKDQNQNEVFNYIITDRDGDTSTASLTINVLGANETALQDDYKRILEDTTATGNVLTNDNDLLAGATVSKAVTADGVNITLGQATAINVNGIKAGDLTLNANGSYEFTPVKDWSGKLPVITYTVGDKTANLQIDVAPQVDAVAPTLANQTVRATVTDPVLTNNEGIKRTLITVNENSASEFSYGEYSALQGKKVAYEQDPANNPAFTADDEARLAAILQEVTIFADSNTMATELDKLVGTGTSDTVTAFKPAVYRGDIGNAGSNLMSAVGGGGSKQSGEFTNGNLNNDPNSEDSKGVVTGQGRITETWVLLKKGDVVSFKGYADDAVKVELGGKDVVKGATGRDNAWGVFDSTNTNSHGGSENNNFVGTGAVTIQEDGYYSLKVYNYNSTRTGAFDIRMSTNGGVSYQEINTTNFDLYADKASIPAGTYNDELKGTLRDTNDSDASEGYYAYTAKPTVTSSLATPLNLDITRRDVNNDNKDTNPDLTKGGHEKATRVTIAGLPVGTTIIDDSDTNNVKRQTVTDTASELDVTDWNLSAIKAEGMSIGEHKVTVTHTITDQTQLSSQAKPSDDSNGVRTDDASKVATDTTQTSTDFTIKVLSTPNIKLDPPARVSEEGLRGGVVDFNPASKDYTNEVVTKGGIKLTAVDSSELNALSIAIEVDSNLRLTSNNQPVTWTKSTDGLTWTGSAGGQTILTIAVDNNPVREGDQIRYTYTTTLHNRLDHPVTTEEDTLDVPFTVKVMNGATEVTKAQQTFVVVEDDSPKRDDVVHNIQIGHDKIVINSLQAGFTNTKFTTITDLDSYYFFNQVNVPNGSPAPDGYKLWGPAANNTTAYYKWDLLTDKPATGYIVVQDDDPLTHNGRVSTITNGKVTPNTAQIDSDGYGDAIYYGRPSTNSPNFQAGYVLTDNEALRPTANGTGVTFDKITDSFSLGQFTHENFPTVATQSAYENNRGGGLPEDTSKPDFTANRGSLSSTVLTAKFKVDINGVAVESPEIDIQLYHAETRNSGTSRITDDFVFFKQPTRVVQIGDTTYKLVVEGVEYINSTDKDGQPTGSDNGKSFADLELQAFDNLSKALHVTTNTAGLISTELVAQLTDGFKAEDGTNLVDALKAIARNGVTTSILEASAEEKAEFLAKVQDVKQKYQFELIGSQENMRNNFNIKAHLEPIVDPLDLTTSVDIQGKIHLGGDAGDKTVTWLNKDGVTPVATNQQGEAVITNEYGTFIGRADGSYKFVAAADIANQVPASAKEGFDFKYTYTDADGDTTVSNITFNFEGLTTADMANNTRDFSFTKKGDSNDYIVGSTKAEEIQAGLGDDTVIGNGGADVIIGGFGNDVLYYGANATIFGDNATFFNGNWFANPTDAELDFDILSLANWANIDNAGVASPITLNANNIKGIEAIDMTNDFAQTLNIKLTDVLAITDSRNTLYVTGDNTGATRDTVDIDTLLTKVAGTAGTHTRDGVTYDTYTATVGASTATLYIEQGITVI